MPRLLLGLVLHNHQPVGNYGFVIQQLYEQAYEPMLALLERHPGVRAAMHNSGPLYDWLLENRPEYIDRLRALCDRGQIELVTGGYYEPVLPMIPDGDKHGQISKMTSFIRERFDQTPTGLWLTERVWEPGLPAPLARAGVEWTLVDDAHFRMVGLRDDQLDGYFVTEDQGERVKLFAGSQRLRYTIPWLNVEDLIAELRARADAARSDDVYIVLGDDGEKFGGWPTTYAHVWEKGWMERFFTALEHEQSWLQTMTPGEYARTYEARGLTYLASASYAEMMEWAMPTPASAEYHRVVSALEEQGRSDVLALVRGGFWRYFLAKYPESNAMHKRGLRIDAKLAERDDDAARDALWKAQCNCPYWHGVFGGLYLRHVRGATNGNLVRAERLADAVAGAGTVIRREDLDYDGHDEVLVQTPQISLMLHPALGGMMSELDFRRRDHAALDVVARRREAYHESLLAGTAGQHSEDLTNIHGGVRLKDEGLAEHVVFDAYRRGGLQEWILPPETDVAKWTCDRSGASFEPDGTWTCEVMETPDGAAVTLAREHDGMLVQKRVSVAANAERVDVRYAIQNTGDEHRSQVFLSEWNLAAPQATDGDDRIATLHADVTPRDLTADAGALDANRIELRGSGDWALACDIEGGSEVWHFPVESVSSSEGGLERVYQGASIAIVRRLEVAPGERHELSFAWSAR